MFLSIIVPFNSENRYLKDCLDSLNEQNLKDYEIIIIQNGVSPIDELLNEYSNLNIILKSFDNELGVSKARNEGLKIASGDYIYFIDSDDYLSENALEELIYIAERTDADLINGERVNTPLIKERFNEKIDSDSFKPLSKKNLSDLQFFMKLLVGTKTNRLEVLTVLHCMIRKEKITECFDENTRYHSDYNFMLSVIENSESFIGVENSIYAKRSRDDPVNSPSLNQEEKEDKFVYNFNDYFNARNSIINRTEAKYVILMSEFSDKILRYYLKRFAIRFLSSSEEKWRNEYFDIMVSASKDFNLNKVKHNRKKEIIALQNANKKDLRKYISIRARFNKARLILKKKWMFKYTIYKKFYNNNPIQDNKIIFISFMGKYYSDSPKYLYEYLYENHKDDFEFIWVLNNKNVKIPGNPKIVKRFSLQYYKEIAQAKYWVTNGRQPKRLKKREEQVIISTWHGTPLKKLGLDIDNIHSRDPKIKKSYIKVASEWDYLISASRYNSDILKSAFNYQDGEIIESGYPRNDILYNATQDKVTEIKKKLKIPSDKKTILYAPTWRDDEYIGVGQINFELKLKLDEIQKALSDEYVLLVRTHYFIANQLDLKPYKGFAIDVCDYDDIAELYLVSDILITDYSSVFFDYANLKRPMLFYTYDLDKYENVLRGFYIDIRTEVPGPLLKTTEEVIDSIKNIDKVNEEYHEKYEEFYERFCGIDDGNASKRIYDAIWK